MRHISMKTLMIFCVASPVAMTLSSCARTPNPFASGLTSPLSEKETRALSEMTSLVDDHGNPKPDLQLYPGVNGTQEQFDAFRRNYISMKMYFIDQDFLEYSHKIGKEDVAVRMFGDLAQIGLSAAGGAIPAGQMTKILSLVAANVGSAKALYDKDVLLTQTMEIIQTQMRNDRATIRTDILTKMTCKPSVYPFGMVLSDLQSYAEAGTVTSAIANLSKTVTKGSSGGGASSGPADETPSLKVQGGTITAKIKYDPDPCPLTVLRSTKPKGG